MGEKIDSSQFKTILAVLILCIGIAIAYDTFISEDVVVVATNNGVQSLGKLAKFILEYSKDLPVFYGLTSVVLAITLGVGAAGIRRLISNWNKKRIANLQASK